VAALQALGQAAGQFASAWAAPLVEVRGAQRWW